MKRAGERGTGIKKDSRNAPRVQDSGPGRPSQPLPQNSLNAPTEGLDVINTRPQMQQHFEGSSNERR